MTRLHGECNELVLRRDDTHKGRGRPHSNWTGADGHLGPHRRRLREAHLTRGTTGSMLRRAWHVAQGEVW